MTGKELKRTSRAPERIVHLGLGAFHRAHQAWYTARAADAADWGIVAFTGASTELVTALGQQDDLYTLVERGPDGDSYEVIDSIVRVASGANGAAVIAAIARPEIAIVTLTITEAAYCLGPDGEVDLKSDLLRSDIDLLAEGGEPKSALGRLVGGLRKRWCLDSAPLAIVSCDNIPNNGFVLRNALLRMASNEPNFADWIRSQVGFVSTSVDRITPRVGDGLALEVLLATGNVDGAPVATEPFSDWVLAGEFPAGRPRWESAGARFVEDTAAWERRKLWMLNGAHTLLSNLGIVLGIEDVASAICDSRVRSAVDAFWDEAELSLSEPDLEITVYLADLVKRFSNPRIEHRLEQIALDSDLKLQARIVPVARLEIGAGRSASGCALAIAAWIAAVQIEGTDAGNARSSFNAADVVLAVIAHLDVELSRSASFVEAVRTALIDLTSSSTRSTEREPAC